MIRLAWDGGVIDKRELLLLCFLFDPVKFLMKLFEVALHQSCFSHVQVDVGCLVLYSEFPCSANTLSLDRGVVCSYSTVPCQGSVWKRSCLCSHLCNSQKIVSLACPRGAYFILTPGSVLFISQWVLYYDDLCTGKSHGSGGLRGLCI